MKIIEKKITELIPYENNPRNNDNAVSAVAESISNFGWKVPVVIDADGVIIADKNGKPQKVEVYKKHVPPDVKALNILRKLRATKGDEE